MVKENLVTGMGEFAGKPGSSHAIEEPGQREATTFGDLIYFTRTADRAPAS
jgi:hypothetical protein